MVIYSQLSFSIIESDSIVLSCDFFNSKNHLVTTNLEGEVNIISVNDDFHQIRHETLQAIN